MSSAQSVKPDNRSISDIELEIARLQRSIILDLGKVEVELLHYRDNLFGNEGATLSRRLGFSTVIGAAKRYPLSAMALAAVLGFATTVGQRSQVTTARKTRFQEGYQKATPRGLGIALAGLGLEVVRELLISQVQSPRTR